MDGLVSGTIYAALSAAAAAQPGASGPVTAVTATVALAEPATSAEPGAAAGYVIVDIPAFNRSADTRPSIEAEPEAAGDAMERAGRDPAASQEGGPARAEIAVDRPVDATLNEAVIAAHDAHIRLLKQRIETARLEGGAAAAAAIARALDIRLKRAEAARGLAIARSTPAEARGATQRQDLAREEEPATPGLPRSAARSTQMPGIDTAVPQASIAEASPRRVARPRDTKPLAQAHAAAPPAEHAGTDRTTADRLAQAGRSLATARRLLEGEASDRRPAISAFAVLRQPLASDRSTSALTAERRSPQTFTSREAVAAFGYTNARLFLDFAAAKFGLAIASLLLLVALGGFLQPRMSVER